MIKIDLITGFLGSGKTTFLKQYAKYLMAQGKNIGILVSQGNPVDPQKGKVTDPLAVR